MGKEKGQKKTACQDCVGIFWRTIYAPGSVPIGKEARCKKSENEIIKETGFNPVTGEDIEYEYYPGGRNDYFIGEKYKLCTEVNKGNCLKFEEHTEKDKADVRA